MSSPAALARETPRPPDFRRRLTGWVRLPHAFPVAAVTTVTFLLALLSGGADAGVSLAIFLAVTMFFGQCSIGIHNDLLDRDRDAIAKPAKPIPSGAVSVGAARLAAVAALAVFVGLHAWLTWTVLAIGVAALSAGYFYNAVLKHTAFGPLAYVAGFALLALWVWVATDALSPAVAWTFVFGGPLIVGLGLANALPDIEADRRTAVPTLASRLGARRAVAAVWAAAAGAAVLMLAGAWIFDARAATVITALAIALVLAAAGLHTSLRGRHWAAFRLYAAVAAVLVVGWLLAVP